MGRALAACFVVMAVLAPNLDAIVCAGEGLGPAPESHGSSAVNVTTAAEVDDHGAPGRDGNEAVCAHGHCHHGVEVALPQGAGPRLSVEASARLAAAPLQGPLFDLQFGFERPPRA